LRRRLRAATAGATVLVLTAAIAILLPFNATRYLRNVPLDLPGATLLRLPENQAAEYQYLARLVRTQADTVITESGFNSLYFWSRQPPPTLSVFVLTERQQANLADAVTVATRPLALLYRRGNDSLGRVVS